MPRSSRFKRKQTPIKLIPKKISHNKAISKNNNNGNSNSNGNGQYNSNGLTHNKQIFSDEWLKERNGTKAYKVAFPGTKNDNVAAVQAHALLREPKIAKYVAKKVKELSTIAQIDTEWVLERYKLLSDYNVYDFFDDSGNLRPLSTIPKKKLYAVCGIKVAKKIITQKDLETVEKTIIQEFKLPDKRAVLDSLGKYLGMFEKDNDQKRQPLQINVMVVD